MKRTALALMLIALAASCDTEPKTAVQKKVDSYALVKIESPDLSGITDNGKEVLNLYKFAADQADSIYWKQYFGDKTLIENLNDPDLRDYAEINYGPWDRLAENSLPFGTTTLLSTTSTRSAITSRLPLTSPSSQACATTSSRRLTL